MAKIQQYVYTRLSKERSPRGKLGFQSVFLPEAWHERGFILELESRIHFPKYDTFSEKNVVFYQDLGGVPHLILLWMRLLPELRDEQGRSGIFMVHGFIVPPEVHRLARRPVTLMKLLEPYLFLDIEDAMNSPLADHETALIQPVEVDTSNMWQGVEAGMEQIGLWERQLLSFIYKQVQGELDDWTLALKGHPEEIQKVMDHLAGYLPNDIREKVGWDPAFDGGKVFFSAFKTFGYSRVEPVTGRPLFFDLETKTFLDSSLSHQLLVNERPFDRFLRNNLKPETPQEEIEQAYALSASLYAGKGVPPGMQLQGGFADSIQDLSRTYFENLATEHVPHAWAMAMREALDYETICQAMNGQMGLPLLGICLERTIVAFGVTPSKMGESLSDDLVKKGTARLELLHTMWTEEPPAKDLIHAIPPNSLQEAFRIMATTKLAKEDWFFRLLAEYPVLFSRTLSDPDFYVHAKKWLTKQIPKSHRGSRNLMVEYMMQTGQLGEMKQDKPEWNLLLEQYLSDGNYNRKELKAVVETVSDLQFNASKYPLLHAFTFPGDKIPGAIGMNANRRQRMAYAMVICHDFGPKVLTEMGFSRQEVGMAMGQRKGIIGKIKSLLGM